MRAPYSDCGLQSAWRRPPTCRQASSRATEPVRVRPAPSQRGRLPRLVSGPRPTNRLTCRFAFAPYDPSSLGQFSDMTDLGSGRGIETWPAQDQQSRLPRPTSIAPQKSSHNGRLARTPAGRVGTGARIKWDRRIKLETKVETGSPVRDVRVHMASGHGSHVESARGPWSFQDGKARFHGHVLDERQPTLFHWSVCSSSPHRPVVRIPHHMHRRIFSVFFSAAILGIRTCTYAPCSALTETWAISLHISRPHGLPVTPTSSSQAESTPLSSRGWSGFLWLIGLPVCQDGRSVERGWAPTTGVIGKAGTAPLLVAHGEEGKNVGVSRAAGMLTVRPGTRSRPPSTGQEDAYPFVPSSCSCAAVDILLQLVLPPPC